MTNTICARISAALLSICAASGAEAAPTNIDARVDTKIDRPTSERPTFELMKSAKGVAEAKDFEFTINMPFTWNSDPGQNGTLQSAWHADPELTLSWTKTLGSLLLEAKLDTDLDRFSDGTSNDSDTLYALVNASWKSSADQIVVPYVGYRHTDVFDPTFDHTQIRLDDYYAGLKANLRLGDETIKFDAQGGHRDSSGLSSDFVKLKACASFDLTSSLTLTVQPRLLVRWFDTVAGKQRRDVTPDVLVYLAYKPDISVLSTKPEIDFSIAYVRNDSTKASSSYDFWDVGPSVSLSWDF